MEGGGHTCSGECDSIHKHILSKLLLILKEGRPELGGKDESITVRHIASPAAEPKKSLNKWVLLVKNLDNLTGLSFI